MTFGKRRSNFGKLNASQHGPACEQTPSQAHERAPVNSAATRPTPTHPATVHLAPEQLNFFVDGINSQMPDGVSVALYFMIPRDFWEDDLGKFLEAICGCGPHPTWNMALLPTTSYGSLILDLPEHTTDYSQAYRASCFQVIQQSWNKLRNQAVITYNRLEQGSTDTLMDSAKAKTAADAEIYALAQFLFVKRFGVKAFNRHSLLFGKALGLQEIKLSEDADA